MFSILNRALSWAITSFGNKFCLKMRSRLIKALNNRFCVKFMQLEIGLLVVVVVDICLMETRLISIHVLHNIDSELKVYLVQIPLLSGTALYVLVK